MKKIKKISMMGILFLSVVGSLFGAEQKLSPTHAQELTRFKNSLGYVNYVAKEQKERLQKKKEDAKVVADKKAAAEDEVFKEAGDFNQKEIEKQAAFDSKMAPFLASIDQYSLEDINRLQAELEEKKKDLEKQEIASRSQSSNPNKKKNKKKKNKK